MQLIKYIELCIIVVVESYKELHIVYVSWYLPVYYK